MKRVIRLTENDLIKLVKKVIYEENTVSPSNIATSLQVGDVLLTKDKENKPTEIKVFSTLTSDYKGFVGIIKKINKEEKYQFNFGYAPNQIRFTNTEIGDYDFTVDFVVIDGKKYPVDKEGYYKK